MKKVLSAAFSLLLLFVSSTSHTAVQNVSGAGTTAINADGMADGVSFTGQGGAESTLTVADGQNINNNTNATGVITDADLKGNIEFAGDSLVNGTVGSAMLRLNNLNANGSTGDIVYFLGNSVSMDTATIQGGSNMFFHSDVLASSINLQHADSSSGFFVNGRVIQTDITTNVNGTGFAEFNGNSTFTGNIGTLGTTLDDVLFFQSGTMTVNGNVFATEIRLGTTGTVAFNGDITAPIQMNGNGGALVYGDDDDQTGAITTLFNNTGTLTFNGTSTVTGQVGTNIRGLSAINGGVAGETVIFNDDVYVTTLNVTGTGDVILNGDLAGILDFDANGTVTLSDASFITGDVTNSSGAAAGTLVFNGDSSVSGQIGASGVGALSTIVSTGSSKLVVFGQDVYATTINETGGSQLAFGGNIYSDISLEHATSTIQVGDHDDLFGTVTTTIDGAGRVSFVNDSTISEDLGVAGAGDLESVGFNLSGSFIQAANIAATLTSVYRDASLTMSGDRTITGNLTMDVDATLDLGTTTLTNNGTGIFTTSSGTIIASTIASASDFGNIIASGNASVDAGTILDLTVTGTLSNGTSLKIIDGAGGMSVNIPTTINDDIFGLNFEASVDSGDLILRVSRNSIIVPGLSGNALNMANYINNLNTADSLIILRQLDAITDARTYQEALNSLVPSNISAGTASVSFSSASNMVTALVRSNPDSSGLSSGQTGISSGDLSGSQNLWARGYGSYADQDQREGVDGFDSSSWGTLIGYDKQINEAFVLGLASGYGRSDVDGDGISNTQSEIDSIPVLAYAQTDINQVLLDFGGGFIWHQYDSTRDIPFLSSRANSDYDGQHYVSFIQASKKIEQKILDITPIVGLQYHHLDLDDYTETGAGAANLSVQDQDYDMLVSTLGLKFSKDISLKSGSKIIPSIKATYNYDFIGDEVQTTASFVSANNTFTATGFEPAQHSFNLGADLTLITAGNWTLSTTYDLELKEDFYSHNGSVTAKYKF